MVLSAESVMKQVYGTQTVNWDGFSGVPGTAGRRGANPKGVIIHNDYGSANGFGYKSWLSSARIPNPELGYAHYYGDTACMLRAVPTTDWAYHAGDYNNGNFGNFYLIGFEVDQSLTASYNQFLRNEEVVFIQAAEDLLYYNLPVNTDTVRLHREFTSTSCPHRSWDIHVGQGTANTSANQMLLKRYFVSRIQFWTDVLTGKKPIPQKDYLPTDAVVADYTPTSTNSNTDAIAREVIAGKWGNGEYRKTQLEKAGYNYNEVQSRVSAIMKGEVTVPSAKYSEGWHQDEYGWWYVENGEYVKDAWKKINSAWYLFNEKGYIYINEWAEKDGKWYLFDEDGRMRTGWHKLNEKWYHLKDDGQLSSKEFVAGEDGRLYYVNADGEMLENTEITVAEDGSLIEKATGKIVGKF